MKFKGSGSKATRVIERKRSVTDGQTDRRTRQKQYVSTRGEGHNKMWTLLTCRKDIIIFSYKSDDSASKCKQVKLSLVSRILGIFG